MKQIRYSIKLLATAVLALSMAGCANDDAVQENISRQPGTEGMTEFAVIDDGADVKPLSSTRTSGEYTGSSVKFYWTSGDRLWINDATAVTPLKASSRSDIPTTNGKETSAKFYFDGVYSAPSYSVRYTGSGSTAGDKVTIGSDQAQQTPNDGAHLGTAGDCGTAVAVRQSDGSYRFAIEHKASYLTFSPYYSIGFTADVKVTQIKVTADQAIAGTYDFDDTGIILSAATATSRSVTLTLNGGGAGGFEIPTSHNHAKNAAIMVIAPGSYTNFTVEYTLHDQVTGVTGTVSKNYGSITCTVGKNRKVAADLAVINRGDKLYMWDAKQHYWYGYEANQPFRKDAEGANYPTVSTDQRWYNSVTVGSGQSYAATQTAKNCPNVNEMLWYVHKGNPHWDGTRLFSFSGHLYKGGMWFKKRSVILSDNGITAAQMKANYGQTDYRKYTGAVRGTAFTNTTIASGPPANTGNYFFLPACYGFYLGKIFTSTADFNYGDYWTSTPKSGSGDTAYNLAFTPTSATVAGSNRRKGAMTISFE